MIIEMPYKIYVDANLDKFLASRLKSTSANTTETKRRTQSIDIDGFHSVLV